MRCRLEGSRELPFSRKLGSPRVVNAPDDVSNAPEEWEVDTLVVSNEVNGSHPLRSKAACPMTAELQSAVIGLASLGRNAPDDVSNATR